MMDLFKTKRKWKSHKP